MATDAGAFQCDDAADHGRMSTVARHAKRQANDAAAAFIFDYFFCYSGPRMFVGSVVDMVVDPGADRGCFIVVWSVLSTASKILHLLVLCFCQMHVFGCQAGDVLVL